jgi:hypothetical protein
MPRIVSMELRQRALEAFCLPEPDIKVAAVQTMQCASAFQLDCHAQLVE